MADNALWTWAVASYQQYTVAEALLALQDDYGADINILLCCCWLASQGQQLSEQQARHLIKCCASWQGECIKPLRQVRRYLKKHPEHETFRQQIKALELEAERVQLDMLYQQLSTLTLVRSEAGFHDGAMRNLENYLRTLPGVEWGDVIPLVSDLLASVNCQDQ